MAVDAARPEEGFTSAGATRVMVAACRAARPLRADGDGPDDDAVAAYVAKYVTKGASETGAGTDYRLTTWSDVGAARVTNHVRALPRTCWRLGGLPEYEPLRLRTWAHTLGYRGHIEPFPTSRASRAVGLTDR
ncbi:replication initiator [Streptomyces sp. NPDC060006]|uniref:replication initiator n=2 Tax=unclassified Streptomyces TaxID=2593676 RepID=UPI0036A87C0D